MIKYKLLKAQLTDTVYPQQVESRSFTHKDIEKALVKHYGCIAPAILGETVRLINEKLADGMTVALEGLGTFSIRLGMKEEHVAEFEQVHSGDVRISGVRFNACKEMRRQLREAELHEQKGSAQLRKAKAEHRWMVLHEYMLNEFNNSGYATINANSYARLLGCTGYTARKELEQFAAEGKLQLIPTRRLKLYILAPGMTR